MKTLKLQEFRKIFHMYYFYQSMHYKIHRKNNEQFHNVIKAIQIQLFLAT